MFEDDEDDRDERTGLVAFATKLHLRSVSAGARESEEKRALKKEKKFGRNASKALKGVFKKK